MIWWLRKNAKEQLWLCPLPAFGFPWLSKLWGHPQLQAFCGKGLRVTLLYIFCHLHSFAHTKLVVSTNSWAMSGQGVLGSHSFLLLPICWWLWSILYLGAAYQ